MTFDKKWRFPTKMILSRIQFSTEKHDRLSLNDDSCHSQRATDEATKQENSMFSNGTKRTGSIAPDTMLISVFDLTTAVFPAREVQLTWRAAGCFSTPSHLLLSLRKLSRGKPPHAAAEWILIPVLWICIGNKKGRTGGKRLICLRRYHQKMWQSKKSHFFQPLCRGVLFAAEKLTETKHVNQDISVFGKWKQTCSNTHTIWSRRKEEGNVLQCTYSGLAEVQAKMQSWKRLQVQRTAKKTWSPYRTLSNIHDGKETEAGNIGILLVFIFSCL